MQHYTIRDVIPGPSDAAALAHALVTANEHAFRGLVPDQCLEFTEAESAANWLKFLNEGIPKLDIMIVAENSTNEVVAYAWGSPDPADPVYTSELRQISVLPQYQGQGIGRQLVCHIAQRLSAQGINSMKVRVLKVNPNRVFYERLGAVFVSEQLYNWDGVELPEYTYGWKDLKTRLLDQCNS